MNKALLADLDALLNQYDSVFLVDTSHQDGKSRWERFLRADVFHNCGKKILFVVTEDANIPETGRHSCLKITVDAFRELKSLYFLYEFSDRFKLFSNDTAFGEIWNYVDTGILTEEEAFRSILVPFLTGE